MKTTMVKLLGLFGVAMSITAPAAAYNYSYNCQNTNNCCEWSMCDGRFSVGADWLYWKTEIDNTVGTVVSFEDLDEQELGRATFGNTRTLNHQYDNGFRVWAGYELPCDCWDIGVSYTYLPSNAKISSFESENPFDEFSEVFVADLSLLEEISNDFDSPHFFDVFSAKWNSNINWIDVDLGRSICFGDCFKFRPHAGFRAAWMDQKYRTFGVEVQGETDYTIFASRINQKFNGYGIQGGIWGDWQLGCNLSIVGHVGGSILASKFKIDERSIITDVSGSAEPISTFYPSEGRNSFWTTTPSVDYFLGVKFEDCFCDMVISAHVGWEQHLFFNLNRFNDCCGNLSTQGLTLGLEVGF